MPTAFAVANSAPSARASLLGVQPQASAPALRHLPACPVEKKDRTSSQSTEACGWRSGCAVPVVAGVGLRTRRRRQRATRIVRAAETAVAEPVVISEHRTSAVELLADVQEHFVSRLEAVTVDGASSKGDFKKISWERDGGVHGGGQRFGVVETPIFNRGSVNYSAVNYDDTPEKPVKSATALSVIIHPRNPHAPSMHCHFSYTEPRSRAPYWRMISDLNPSLHSPQAKNKFEKTLKQLCPEDLFDDGKLFGDKYFFIPELNMYRGTSHLFIAELSDTEVAPESSRALAESLAKATINTYTNIIQELMDAHPHEQVTDLEREQQLAYHTAYFYQVLFLDCGTTAGLLAHSENDVGTLASLPSYVDRELLASWKDDRVRPPHDLLLSRMLAVLPEGEGPCHVTDDIRQELATILREYYVEDMSRAKAQADMDLKWWARRKEG